MEAKDAESHMISAAAFVEGGIQEDYGEACSICLDEFCDSDPSVVTSCKHEFHLHCILEWCQRSSQCPMCWQPISLKDPCSQELLEGVERERRFRETARNATIFHHPTLGDFQFQHLPVGTTNAELEERIIQHLAAAASMGRAHHYGRRESHRSRSSARGHPHFSVPSTHPSASPLGPVHAPGGDSEPAEITVASPSTPLTSDVDESSQRSAQYPSVQTDGISSSPSGSSRMHRNRQGNSSSHWSSSSHASSLDQDRAGPSELHSLSESLKSKFNSMSMRYKESFSRSTRGLKERLFSRSPSMSELSSEVRREVNAGIATVSRMMERLETRDNTTDNQSSVVNQNADGSAAEQSNQNRAEIRGENPLSDNNRPGTTCAAGCYPLLQTWDAEVEMLCTSGRS
ncbi:hypothetical protein C1H46_026366 [Malus baccata]|uniref:RING-type E3 ubiquitin transferase n=1 Tax=Malus baccata TaxID=106549 RepID=A0A540LP19_MALBA|nr:hypothetical protein C1H46_026366 [Malus baccata]